MLDSPMRVSRDARQPLTGPGTVFPPWPRQDARYRTINRPAFLLLLSLLFTMTPGLRADTVIQIIVGGDMIALPQKPTQTGKCQLCVDPARPGDPVTIFATKERVRRDRGALSIILRKDVKEILLMCRTTKEYAELPYPVKARELEHQLPISIEDDLRQYRLAGPSTSGRSQFKEWQVETFDASVVNGFRDQYRLHIAVADLGGAGGGTIMEFTKLLNYLQHAGHGWSELLPFERGMPVVLEEAQRQPETEFLYREEVTQVTEKEVPADCYEVPADYRKVRFEPDCFRFR